MKILTIVSASYRGGATYSLLNLIRGLNELGHEIIVITPEYGYLCEELDKEKIQYFIVPVVFSIWPAIDTFINRCKFLPRLIKMLIYNKVSYFKIKKIISKIQPDLIHTNVSVISTGYKIAKELGIPHIWHIREYGDKDFSFIRFPSNNIFRNKIIKDANAICITKDLLEYFSLQKNGTVIYNGIEGDYLNYDKSTIENKFIYVGYISDGKGVPSLIKAFKEFSKYNDYYTLELWGRCAPKYKKYILKLIDSLGLSDRVFLMGPSSNIYSIMQTAKAIIVPSKFEGFGRITAEAMINNCLVIGRNTGGTKEQFDNGLNITGHEIGIRFNSDPELSECLVNVANMGNDIYFKIIKDAHQVAVKLYNVQNNIEQTNKYFLRNICNNECPSSLYN